MITLDETQMATIDDPGLGTIQESGRRRVCISIEKNEFETSMKY